MNKEKALELLKKNREECVPFSSFGNDNKSQLSVMIKVLENDWEEDEVYDCYEDSEDLFQAALSAIEMRETGFKDVEQYLYPVK